MKKSMCLILSIMMMFSIIPFSTNYKVKAETGYFNGDGTSNSPYQIDSEEKLILLSDLISSKDSTAAEKYAKSYYIQTSDINLTSKFNPIGSYPGVVFYGEYNGNYHSITDLNIEAEGSYIGLFGWVKSGTIKNLSVYGKVVGKHAKDGDALIGGIVGEMSDNSTITNCSFNGSVNGEDSNIGGIAGQMARGGILSGCYFNGEVNGLKNVGGLIGFISDQNDSVNLNVNHCYMVGNVISNSSDKSVGGVVGNVLVENTNSTLNFESNFYLYSACAGAVNSSKQTGCIQAGENALKAWYDTLGNPFVENNENNDFNDGYPIFAWQVTPYKFNGSGTQEDPYQISSKKELEIMRDYVNSSYLTDKYKDKCYIQTADIDLNNEKWIPIGTRMINNVNLSAPLFWGSYNGNHHTIKNLYVEESGGNSYKGLFGSVRGNGIIENLIVYGSIYSNGNAVGGIAGELVNGNAIVRNCAFIGDVYGVSNVGGIAGVIYNNGTVDSCYHIGKIEASKTDAGGIIGTMSVGNDYTGTATVMNCYNVGIVGGSGKNGSIVGFMVNGKNKVGELYVKNCYSIKDESSITPNGEYNEYDVMKLSSALLKNASSELGSSFINAENDSVNNGYPIFIWQQPDYIMGDANADGKFDIADIVVLQKWILAVPKVSLVNWKAVDFCEDNEINSFDLSMAKKMLVQSGNIEGYPKSISLNKTSANLDIEGNNSKIQLVATVLPENVIDNTVSWTSNDINVATVSDTGLVTAVGSGSAIITAKTNLGGKSVVCRITVENPSIKINTSSLSLYIGETTTLSATTIPSTASVTWSSSNTAVATVSGGKITAVAAGETTITAKININGKDYTATCKVTVSTPSIKLNKSSTTLYLAGTETLTATVVPSGQPITWSSSNTAVATVSGGKITAVAAGTSDITAKITVNGKSYSATCKVIVKKPNITLSKSNYTMWIGDTVTLTPTTDPGSQNVTWTSSNTSVATVSSSGKVTAQNSGSATITGKFSYGGNTYSATCTVNVTTPTVTLSSYSGSGSQNVWDIVWLTSGKMGYCVDLPTATASPSGCTISWEIESGSAVILSGQKEMCILQPKEKGVIKAVATITYNGKTYKSSPYTYSLSLYKDCTDINYFYKVSNAPLHSTANRYSFNVPKGAHVNITEIVVNGDANTKGSTVYGKTTYNGETGWIIITYVP